MVDMVPRYEGWTIIRTDEIGFEMSETSGDERRRTCRMYSVATSSGAISSALTNHAFACRSIVAFVALTRVASWAAGPFPLPMPEPLAAGLDEREAVELELELLELPRGARPAPGVSSSPERSASRSPSKPARRADSGWAR